MYTPQKTGERPRRSPRFVSWHWATPEAQAILATRNLSAILKYHRRVHGDSQTQTGELLGYDKTYVSALELGKRHLNDVGSLRHVAERLSLPPHVLGVTDPADADHRAMLQFGQSTVRLAEIARQSGHATEAVAELWPLVARLEARARDGNTEREVLRLLAHARLGLGTALGNVLPEERLATAAHWTAQSLDVVRIFDDPALTTTALRMHGNELRKSGLVGAAVHRLVHAAAVAPNLSERAAVLPLLARAAGSLGNQTLFDRTIEEAHQLLDEVDHTSLVNPTALYEIHLRGLIATGRADDAIRRAEAAAPTSTISIAPQWRVIELITTGRVRLLAGDQRGATELLVGAVREARAQRLPHQLQRVLRAAGDALPDAHESAEQALTQLRTEMAA
ncbi:MULTISPECIES: helix-turn-helix domain-containing protein [unclassified Streptomyces]|uniref:helix-turn-helix domain-containing protein n=1 Tax=unclassified Streptomyces TaxID=2593676 RepID=UPI0019551701|nr:MULTISPECIES: helix-turn-helix domain-containing protein [unclassified Streptomyces]